MLVNTPEAQELFDMVLTGEKSLNAVLGGGEENVEPAVRADYQSLRLAMKQAFVNVKALEKDRTRPSEPEKHAASQKIATALATKIDKTKAEFDKRADQLETEAVEEAERVFGPKSERAALHSEIRVWVRERMSKGEGLATVREAMKNDDDLAAVIYHSPSYLLSLTDSLHEKLRGEALRTRQPKIAKMFDAAIQLQKFSEKLGSLKAKIGRTLFNPQVAQEAGTRVEVP